MEIKTQLGKSGRLLLPVKIRKALDLHPGDEIVLRLEEGQIKLIPLRQAVSIAQQRVKMYVPENKSLVESLIRERRAEAEHE